MKRHKLLSLYIIFIALGPVSLFYSCARVDLGNDIKNTNHSIARLYVGLSSSPGKQIIEISDIESILEKHFDGATLQESTGFYKGDREKSLIITILNCCRWEEPENQFLKRIKHLATELRHALDQESILVEYTSAGKILVFEIME